MMVGTNSKRHASASARWRVPWSVVHPMQSSRATDSRAIVQNLALAAASRIGPETTICPIGALRTRRERSAIAHLDHEARGHVALRALLGPRIGEDREELRAGRLGQRLVGGVRLDFS